MNKSLKDISRIIDKFCVDRGWENNDPNQLICSLMIELGELAEHYQWKSKFKKLTEDEIKEIGYEFVDVLFYFLRLSSKSNIDIEKYFDEKIEKLAIKFPIGSDWEKQHKIYRQTGKNKKYE